MAWKVDPVHSQVQFSVRHMMISTVHGRFAKFSGTVEFDEENPTRSFAEVDIDAASIDTRDPQRDGHLRSPDFLDAQKFPQIVFKSSNVEVLDDAHGRMTGDLTIRGETHPVVMDVEYSGQVKTPWGHTSAGFSATTKFNRKVWGLNWNQLLETGAVMVGDEVKVTIDVELIKQEAPAQAAVAPAPEAAPPG